MTKRQQLRKWCKEYKWMLVAILVATLLIATVIALEVYVMQRAAACRNAGGLYIDTYSGDVCVELKPIQF